MSATRWFCWGSLLLAGCSGSGVALGPCDDLCRELVQTCDYQAFPTLESCLEGCSYYQSEGADVPGQLTCVQGAACDTFAIVECEHQYGLPQ
jgi:hypothetical protein